MVDEPTRAPEHEAIVAAVRAEIERLVPGAPLPGAASAAPPRSQSRCGTPRVADASTLNGQYRALETRVDDLRGNYTELRHDMDARFSALSGEISRQAENTNKRLDDIVTAIGNKGNGDFTKYAGIIGIIVTIAGGVLGGYIKLENDSIGDKITQQGATLSTLISTNASAAAKDSVRHDNDIAELEKSTVPRAELDRRIDRNTNEILGVVKTQTEHSEQLSSMLAEAHDLKADVERLKTDVVKREENVGHWEDYNNRLNLISNRIVELTRDLGGSNPAAQIKDLRDQFNELQRKFIVVPGAK